MGLKGFEGTMLENVARSYQAIQENADDEYAALAKCNAAISHLESLEKEAEGGSGNGSSSLILLVLPAFSQ